MYFYLSWAFLALLLSERTTAQMSNSTCYHVGMPQLASARGTGDKDVILWNRDEISCVPEIPFDHCLFTHSTNQKQKLKRICYQRGRRVRKKGLAKKESSSGSEKKCMRQNCICSRVIPLAHSFEKHRTVLQVSNSHNSTSFSSRVTGSGKITIWHLVEVQRENLWNSKGRGHWQWCHFCTEYGEDSMGHRMSSIKINSMLSLLSVNATDAVALASCCKR